MKVNQIQMSLVFDIEETELAPAYIMDLIENRVLESLSSSILGEGDKEVFITTIEIGETTWT